MEASRPIAPTLLSTTIEALQRHAPFDRMDRGCLEWLVSQLSVVYFAPDTEVLTPEHGAPECLYIVKQGAVLGLDPEHAQGPPHWRLSVGECFPLGALMGERPVTSLYRCAGDTFCYRLQAPQFHKLMERSQAFCEFATRRLSSLLAQSLRAAHANRASAEPMQPLARSIASIVLGRTPVACASGASVREALEKMQRERSDYVLIHHAQGTPAGIFTLRDLRDRVALGGADLSAAIDTVMTPQPLTLPLDSAAFEAAVTMAQHGLHHIVIVDAGRAVGILSESDLFAMQRVSLTALSAGLRAARSGTELVELSQQVKSLARELLRQGVPIAELTRIISTLNDGIAKRLIDLEAAAHGVELHEFCWLALGSEGRHEQTLATDQDNAIVFLDDSGDAKTMRSRLLPLAARVNDTLAACGFPLCKGGVMARNAHCCLSLSEWKARFAQWLHNPDAEALLKATIFFDFRALRGALGPAQELRSWLTANAAGRDVFLRLMATNALVNDAPLGLLRDFAVSDHDGRPDTLDLKVNGAALFIDAARILALACGSEETNTERRLQAAASARHLVDSDVAAWIDAFEFIQGLRLAHQHNQLELGMPGDNFVAPETLNPLDRRILKEAFRQARKLQQRLRLDYRLSL